MAELSHSIGTWIRRRRKALDLTQPQLAARAGCVLTTIKKIETGARRPSRKLAARIADALELAETERAWLLSRVHTPSVDLLVLFPRPPLSPSSRSSQLAPIPPGPLIGRAREAAALRTILAAVHSRVITLTGPGGVGKTHLALHLISDLRDLFVDGIWWIDLAQLSDPALVPSFIARELGLEPGTAPVQTMIRAIGERQMLLALDNMEQVSAAAPGLAQLISATPKLVLLITSRTPLHLAAELVYELKPLELPPTHNAHALDTYAAVQLFLRSARATQADVVLTSENGAAIAAICRRLDGLPLAIELAAAWIRLLPPAALLRRLERRMALLIQGPADLPARQQTLRATLDWSYRLLTPRQQRLFARLSVFAGGASLDAIEAICEATERGDSLVVLRSLIEHSLVYRNPGTIDEPRIHMLETIRDYALLQLGASGAEPEFRSRHARYYLEYAEVAARELRRADQLTWLDSVETEHNNLRAACHWLLAAGRTEEALRLVGALHWFWERRGYLSEGRALIQAALDQAAAETMPNPALRLAWAWALVGAAALAFVQGDPDASASAASTAAGFFRDLGDPRGLTMALLRLAFVRSLTHPETARDLFAEAGIQAMATGEPWFAGLAQFVMAQAALFGAGDTGAARARIMLALPAIRASGDPYLLAHGLGIMGSIDLADRRLDAACTALEEGLAVARTLRDPRSVALIAATTADAARCRGDYGRAAELYSESLALYHTLGNHTEIPAILHNQGYVALGQGDSGSAWHLFRESLRRHQSLKNMAGIAEAIAGLAAVAAGQGALEQAARLFGAAEALRANHPAPIWPAEQIEVGRWQAAARAHMVAATFDHYRRAGHALTLEQAIAEASKLETSQAPGTPDVILGGLTQREREVAVLIAQGFTNRAIAEALVISERTAEHHVANILAKLDYTSRAQIAAWAVTHRRPSELPQ